MHEINLMYKICKMECLQIYSVNKDLHKTTIEFTLNLLYTDKQQQCFILKANLTFNIQVLKFSF